MKANLKTFPKDRDFAQFENYKLIMQWRRDFEDELQTLKRKAESDAQRFRERHEDANEMVAGGRIRLLNDLLGETP